MKKDVKKPDKKLARRGKLVTVKGGGQLWRGMAENHKPGPGRPRDHIRDQLRGIAWGKGLPFLRNLFDGEVPVTFVGTCPKCKHECTEGDLDDGYWQRLQERVDTSIEHRLKASDQTLRYGIGTQTESVSPEDMQASAHRMVEELVTILLDEEHWPTEKVQAVARRIAKAASQPEDG